VRGPILLRFPPDCWIYLHEMQSSPSPVSLPSDVRAILNVTAPHIELRAPIPEPRFIVHMTRSQAESLQRWLYALLESLAPSDDRRLTCLQCIGRVAGALQLSEP
jgi:hypothetical protein